ncbi:GNAT family N-acetyltransferase [Aliivibrio sifiae]|uniref:N-acetyltransferase n=1 Tax=Aliivibrio sifiae TaxID=566293 RepID=A0A2S7X817_9GAMM|nr:GNAT family N-acetyltransferase [Aliivibrio sifiae]PQJ87504.1 GNAT family N-acetyltransferase [Aliivibrio sifiae]GLR77138.1 N-acetyltransferase [Aliivibrio sifiae]
MNIQEVMRIYNKYERKGSSLGGYTKVVMPELVKFVSDTQYGSFISFSELNDENIDRVIESEITYFTELGLSFEWKTYDTDLPINIGEKLKSHRFEKGESESFMALSLNALPMVSINNDECVEVIDEQGIKDAISVQEQVWGGDFSGQLAQLINAKKLAPNDLTIYVVYENALPVASGWIVYTPNSPFAGIWGGSTLKEYRGKGYYSNLLHKRIDDAMKRDVQYLSIDASDMSKPIVEKYGFKFITETTPYTFDHS